MIDVAMETLERCVLCGSSESEEVHSSCTFDLMNVEGFGTLKVRLVICRCCGLVYQNPRLDENERKRLYRNQMFNTPSKEDAEAIKMKTLGEHIEVIRDFVDLKRGGKILEVGAGFGHCLSIFKEFGWECHGIEPSIVCCDFAKKFYQIELDQHFIEDCNFPQSNFDLIMANGVIEHLPDPRSTLSRFRSWLKEGAVLDIGGIPDVKRLNPGLDDELSGEQHLFLFCRQNLRALFESCGFMIVKELYHEESGSMRFIARACDKSYPVISHSLYKDVLYSMRDYKQKRRAIIDEAQSKIQQFIIQKMNSDGKICLYGAGRYLYQLLSEISLPDFPERYFVVDGNLSKSGKKIFGIFVQSPEAIIKNRPSLILICSRAFEDEIRCKLLSLGINNRDIKSMSDFFKKC
jgi:SAM-dependent methyltransferase